MSVRFHHDYRQLAADIDGILRGHGVTLDIGVGDFTPTDRLVTDFGKSNTRLSDAIVQAIWPRVHEGTFVHYTRRKCAESIIASGNFRLYELFKRVSQGEMVDFFQHHGFQGYLQMVNGRPVYHDAMRKLFYASFTNSCLDDHEERNMWEEFAPSAQDVRLVFDVMAENPDFRRVRYVPRKGPGVPLIDQLQARVRMFGGREFLFRGVTRVAAFYLRGTYSEENETRLLHARYGEIQSEVHCDGTYRYVELPIDGQFHYGYRLVPRRIETRNAVDQTLTEEFLALGKASYSNGPRIIA
jgi:hypothetical protein